MFRKWKKDWQKEFEKYSKLDDTKLIQLVYPDLFVKMREISNQYKLAANSFDSNLKKSRKVASEPENLGNVKRMLEGMKTEIPADTTKKSKEKTKLNKKKKPTRK